MKKIILILFVCFNAVSTMAQETLQSVTDRGNITTNKMGIGAAPSSANLQVTSGHTTMPVSYMYNPNIAAGTSRGIAVEGGTNSADYSAIFNKSNGDRILTLEGTGNVGIGTTSPSEKLSVNGKIRAHEIKVEIANWSDFVFAKDYKLPTLQETEKHIQENGHLSGIPSAAEVKANGIDLGEMNAKLLQKIEELTLYLIEKDKKEKGQQEQINQLKQQINTITKILNN